LERRLAAILAADVVGYSRLMGEDETGTLERLKSLRKELVQPKITERKGRIVKLVGDGLLAEFPSVVEAVQCAVDIQKSMSGRETDLPGEQRIRLRIGVNLGDIIVEGSDIYGDGVNVAARLEALADPGGICISGTAFETVYGKLDLAFEDMGEQQVKNITKPVRVYRLASGSQQNSPSTHSAEPLPLPDKPSIAVLPFTNMSGDPEQEYFSDGITEDIITELSRFPELFVIARNSAFVFKGEAVDIKEAANKLGVRYVVEGSVRKAGKRVRITAQLIDAAAGGHIWADRYDRELDDIFEVQDDVVRAIVTVLPGRIADANIEQSRRAPTENLSALDYLMRGNHLASKRGGNHDRAIAAYQKAIELDPKCAAAYAGIAFTESKKIWDLSTSDDDPIGCAYDNARKALAIDDNDYRAHGVMGLIYFERGEHKPARKHLERALTLNPNSTQVMGYWTLFLAYSGEPEKAIETHYRAARLDPYNAEMLDLEALAEAYFMLKQYKRSIAVLETMLDRHYAHQQIAMCYAQLGDMDTAAHHMELYREQMPATYDEKKLYESHMRLCQRKENADLWTEAYRKIGLDV
jgi:TolB-like protein/cytochrome c-type biogenesis protein CcmH/NrfG